ncbi:DarT ssDNA thymidine ADP-ribosyltransferase family protein [Kitasatospora sp. NPDC001095]
MTGIWEQARQRGITRLCHFTKAVNLGHILATGELRGAAALRSSTEGFRPTDQQRLDGYLHHINCSVEYPNTWYLDKVREQDPHFKEWVVLALDPQLLDLPGAGFCPYNAARRAGAGVAEGAAAFEAMFATEVIGNAVRRREPRHPTWGPTDDQAEVLLPGPVSATRISAVIVPTEEQAELERYRLAVHLGTAGLLPTMLVAPELFDKYQLSNQIRVGRRPAEHPLYP